jgi:hypothetical protein
VLTREESDLERIAEPDVQAVIYTPPEFPEWFPALAEAVEGEVFQIPRATLFDISRGGIRRWLEANLPSDAVAREVRRALVEDILALPNRIAALAAVTRLQIRIFTGAPTTDCGFHVDTVPPGAPTSGLLRVYNGTGTAYVDPGNITSVREFYRYLSRRERLERDRAAARRDHDGDRCSCLEAEITRLDEERAFLKRRDEVHFVPTGSIVAFRHLDVRLHWSEHSQSLAWIHCSPTQGRPRLVVNVAAGQVTRCSPSVNLS